MSGAECATSRPTRCIYHKERPQTQAGRLAWAVFTEGAWRVRIAGMGTVIGVETAPMLRALAREGLDEDLAETLISKCEAGFVAAANERDEDGSEKP